MTWTVKDKVQLALIGFIGVVTAANFALDSVLPRLHGRIAPSVGPLTITAIYDGNSDYLSRVAGYAEKYNECPFVRVDWALGDRGGRYATANARFLDRPEIRETGAQYWDRLMVDLEPSQIRNNSFGTVYHDCGWPWLVKTPFYDPPQKG